MLRLSADAEEVKMGRAGFIQRKPPDSWKLPTTHPTTAVS
jgi:hypothetical protein